MRKNLLIVMIIAFSILELFLTAEAETITKPHTFTDGTPAVAGQVNANFNTIYNQVNKIGTEINIDSINHRVGIGTTNPATKLETSGEATIVSNAVTAYGGTSASDVIPVFAGRRARGSEVSPTAVQSGDVFAYFGGKGYGDGWPEFTTAGMTFRASETHSATNQGSEIIFHTTSNSTITRQSRVIIAQSGNVGIGIMNPQSSLQVSGYTQLALTAGSPPEADCNEASEHGRMKVDATGGLLYICVSSGWVAK